MKKMSMYETCPYCGKSILTGNPVREPVFEVKTKRKSVSYVHYDCYEKNKHKVRNKYDGYRISDQDTKRFI